MSACMSGTRGSGVLSSTGDVLVRGVGGVCDMCMCLARGGVGGEGGEWMRELGLGFLTCICLWQISQIQTFLFRVVGPGLVSTPPAFVSNSASHPEGPHGRHAQKTVNRAPNAGGGEVRHNLHSSLSSL